MTNTNDVEYDLTTLRPGQRRKMSADDAKKVTKDYSEPLFIPDREPNIVESVFYVIAIIAAVAAAVLAAWGFA